MTVSIKVLVPAKQTEATQTTQYTAVNCKALIDKFTVTNTSGANVLFSVHLVTSGAVAGPSNLVLDAQSIAPDETYACWEAVGHALEAGGFISTIASVGEALTMRVSGREIT